VIWSVLGVLLITLVVFLPIYVVAKILFGPSS